MSFGLWNCCWLNKTIWKKAWKCEAHLYSQRKYLAELSIMKVTLRGSFILNSILFHWNGAAVSGVIFLKLKLSAQPDTTLETGENVFFLEFNWTDSLRESKSKHSARKEKASETTTEIETAQEKNRFITVISNRIHKLKVLSFSLQLNSLKATQKYKRIAHLDGKTKSRRKAVHG